MAEEKKQQEETNPETAEKFSDDKAGISPEEKPDNPVKQDEKQKQHIPRQKKAREAELIREMQGRHAELLDKYLRLQAEFDNYRKRTLREKGELIKNAGESILLNILPVIDNFDRALSLMKDVQDDDPSKKGILLIYNQFRDFLKHSGLQEIDALNKDFDTDYHEAVTRIPSPTEELKGKVVDIIQKGYLLNDKVIRFSKVVIGE